MLITSPNTLSASGELGTGLTYFGIPRTNFNKWWLLNEWQPGDSNPNDNCRELVRIFEVTGNLLKSSLHKGEKKARLQEIKEKSGYWGRSKRRSGNKSLIQDFVQVKNGGTERERRGSRAVALGTETSFMWLTIEPWLDKELRQLERGWLVNWVI